MLITKENFQNSFYYIGVGLDIEPLFRFSHLCDHFLFANLYLPKQTVKDYYDKELKEREFFNGFLNKQQVIEVVDVQEIDDFDETTHFGLNHCFTSLLENPAFISRHELQGYREAFSEAIHEEQWALVYKIKHIASDREITLVYFTGEGLASYMALSNGGEIAPKVFCTIETKVLEHPNSLMHRFFKTSASRPAIWVRGLEPSQYAGWGYDSKVLDLTGEYNKVALDFNHSWQTGRSYPGQIYSERYCKGFTTQEKLDEIINQPFPFTENHEFIQGSVIDHESDFQAEDLIVTSERISDKFAKTNGTFCTWDDIFEDYFFTMGGYSGVPASIQVKALGSYIKGKQFRAIHIVPFCLENEGKSYLNSITALDHSNIKTYLLRPFDFADLRSIEANQNLLKNTIEDNLNIPL
jgi:hypothetical protein